MKIGVFDSGKGGNTILSEIIKLLPNEDYCYIADSKNCPYGEKSDEELVGIVTQNVEELMDWGAKIIVIACNTATTKCIERLREKYPELLFVGTEPAIRLATKTNARKILVMATPGTIESERTLQLIHDNQKTGQEIELLSCPGLADAIEKDEKIEETLEKIIRETNEDYDLVVLGCTHYSLIKDKIQNYFPKARLIDGNLGVAKRVKALVENLWKNE